MLVSAGGWKEVLAVGRFGVGGRTPSFERSGTSRIEARGLSSTEALGLSIIEARGLSGTDSGVVVCAMMSGDEMGETNNVNNCGVEVVWGRIVAA